jgi:hypothetical protein
VENAAADWEGWEFPEMADCLLAMHGEGMSALIPL